MNKTILALLARHAINAAGAILVSKGLLAASLVEPVSGAVLLIGSVVWSVVQKKRSGALDPAADHFTGPR